ncbi:uncharacterized protein MELLADRAFT_111684 [Melampsora larici-populina 98AG31]|uniref:DUF2423 domain-containing protein n=1 Tax=Melampsora larici-populina (strain 98AG31 / pathotype 3-4-7) TaxID=747676 RepID=F4S409_MELLP|nr:uncharacterized protein MELLADRAFT_111684 [Melampsora larici-populina 98AG31]EGG00621.1 hypothetical protein MELLADRAFT_111684 [Melampsora larici-populina 98AG31]
MAKSLRSKSKRSFRAKKRSSNDSVFKIADTNRTNRLSEKLKESASKPIQSTTTNESNSMEIEKDVEAETEEGTKEGEKVKVATSGHRMSGREVWKSNTKGVLLKRSPSTVFWGKRQPGKPLRRR